MQLLTNIFLLAHQLQTTSGLRVLDNGLGPAVFGEEEGVVDYALLAFDQKAALPSQVCVCVCVCAPYGQFWIKPIGRIFVAAFFD